MNSSETSAKYSWPNSEQNEEIHDSGVPDDVDMAVPYCRRYPAAAANEKAAQGERMLLARIFSRTKALAW